MSDLRKLIDLLEYIENDGELIRELDLTTGRIVSVPLTESLGKLIGAAVGGAASAFGANKFFSNKPESDKPNSNKSDLDTPQSNKSNAVANISDFSNGPVATPTPGQNPNPSGDQYGGKNPNGNNGHDGSKIGPNDDPADPKNWPPGIRPAPDFGYLDPQGMWIPTPFHERTPEGRWRVPTNSPANYIGIMVKNWTPFQQKFHEMQNKSVYLSSSAIEQSKAVQLPGGAPQIPGYKPVDPKRFSSDMNEPGVNVTINWAYAYKNGKNFILIGPMLFYNTKLSIGRHYSTWGKGNLRSDNDKVPSNNGPVYVSAKSFNVNDMILDVVVHVSTGAPNIGAQIIQSIKI